MNHTRDNGSTLHFARKTKRVSRATNKRLRSRTQPSLMELEERRLLTTYSAPTTISYDPTLTPSLSDMVMDSQGNLYGITLTGDNFLNGISRIVEIPKGSNSITTLVTQQSAGYGGLYGLMVDARGNLYYSSYRTPALGSLTGTVYELPAGSQTSIPLTTFVPAVSTYTPYAVDSLGNLYGTAVDTIMEPFSEETIYSIWEIVHGEQFPITLATFNPQVGLGPTNLLIDSQGDLFGTTNGSGANGYGTVFELAAGSTSITNLYSFDATSRFSADFIDSQGNLYGTTNVGGASGDGSIVEFATGSQSLNTLASFNVTGGAQPQSLVMDPQGNLYGSTGAGGSQGKGMAFELAQGSQTITTLLSFDSHNSINIAAADAQGDLFGVGTSSLNGSPTVVELPQGSQTITTIAYVNVLGSGTPSDLVVDSQGNRFGTTAAGGTYGDGTVFEIAKGSNAITTLASFDVPGGVDPSSLIFDSQGNLYGTTVAGGASGDGTVFELAQGSNVITTLASFTVAGSDPSSLALDSQGNLYGTTIAGGSSGNGTVFELVNGSNVITTLASFVSADGAHSSGVVLDSQGNVFGTTAYGGDNNTGMVFEIVKGSNSITALASFGVLPIQSSANPSGLAIDPQGNLYGTVQLYGTNTQGTVFEVIKGSSTVTPLATFTSNDGSSPTGVIVDAWGNLYGTTKPPATAPPFGVTTVFEVAKGSGTITSLASIDEDIPESAVGLAIDSQGNLYGNYNYSNTAPLTVSWLAYEISPSVYLDRSTSTLYVNGDQLSTQNDTITISAQSGNLIVSEDGQTSQFPRSQLSNVVVNIRAGTEVVNVESTFAGIPVAINLTGGNDTVNISPTAQEVSTIRGALTIVGGTGTSIVNVEDTNATGNTRFTLTTSGLRANGWAELSFSGITGLNIAGGTGINTLAGLNTVNTWNITGPNAGNLNRWLGFTGIANLTGGTAMDTFVFANGGSLTGNINGNSGGDWLDYSGLSTPVTVNLATGSATSVGKRVINVSNVRGGSGGNTLTANRNGSILIGGAGNDTLVGGAGRSILIGEGGTDVINGKRGNALEIDGSTTFDGNFAALDAILAEWQSTSDSFKDRVNKIRAGVSYGNGEMASFSSATVTANGTSTLTGGSGSNWFWVGSGSTITNLKKRDRVN